jgi:hypothetical protein
MDRLLCGFVALGFVVGLAGQAKAPMYSVYTILPLLGIVNIAIDLRAKKTRTAKLA